MGLHTWFYKNKSLYLECENLYKKLDEHEDEYGNSSLEEYELLAIDNRINEINAINDADYHDCFRTGKREPGTREYTLDVIYSKEECDKWIADNTETIYYMNKEALDEFWGEHPDGVIDFG